MGGKEEVMEQVRNPSVEPQQRTFLPEITWDTITEPGAYVELGNGDLYRIPREALMPGASPVIKKQSSGASRLVQVSKDPFVTTLQARLLCAEHNIQANF